MADVVARRIKKFNSEMVRALWNILIKSIWVVIGVMTAAFSQEHMGANYARTFADVVAAPDRRPPPRPLAEFKIHPGLGPTWRRWIPESVKKQLRTWAARFGFSP